MLPNSVSNISRSSGSFDKEQNVGTLLIDSSFPCLPHFLRRGLRVSHLPRCTDIRHQESHGLPLNLLSSGKRFSDGYQSALSVLASLTVGDWRRLIGQGFGVALKLTFAGNNQLTHISTYVFAVVVVGCILVQMVRMIATWKQSPHEIEGSR